MTTLTPERTHEQRMAALKHANEIRSERAKLKRSIKAGRTRLATILLDPPPYVVTMKVFDLLVATPKIGRVKANRFLVIVRVSPSKTLGGLSERQRAELLARVNEHFG